jgi:hypothetical protein
MLTSIRNSLFYFMKPMIPRSIQLALRRRLVQRQRLVYRDIWPINPSSGSAPENWPGWPEGKQFALVLTHDVDTAKGQERCRELATLEQQMDFRSSFYFVPRRYKVSRQLREYLILHGFEVGVHDLCHDGKLYKSKKIFLSRARAINDYLREWEAIGFRSGAMHHNLDWIKELDILYDASTFDTDPFEPQPDGMQTIFPFYVQRNEVRGGYVELPYTLPQDFTVFILMQATDIAIWKNKLNWIAEHGGMALVIVHPDYMFFGKGKPSMDEYPSALYIAFLEYVVSAFKGCYWNVLAKDLAKFCCEYYAQSPVR